MSIGHCSCPDCGTTLRIRDRSFVGRTVPCPECHTALVIELDRDQQVSARKPMIDKTTARTKNSSSNIAVPETVDPAASSPPRQPSRWRVSLRRVSSSPLVMAWALAFAMTTLVVVAMTRPSVRFRSPSPVPSRPSGQPEATLELPVAPEESPSMPPSPNGGSSHDALIETPSPSEFLPQPAADATQPANVPGLAPSSPMPVVVPPLAVAIPATNKVQPVAAPPKIDFDVLLKQRFNSFEQSTPVSRRVLIESFEELVGAPIRFHADELGEQNLNKLVTVRRLDNTTLSAMIKSVLDPAGWEFVTDDTELRIRLKPRGDVTSKP